MLYAVAIGQIITLSCAFFRSECMYTVNAHFVAHDLYTLGVSWMTNRLLVLLRIRAADDLFSFVPCYVLSISM